MERSRAQLEVDWQRRCEDTEREMYNKQEQLIAALTKQRDEVSGIGRASYNPLRLSVDKPKPEWLPLRTKENITRCL